MDAPTPIPAAISRTGGSGAPELAAPRSGQFAIAGFLILLLGLLAFRGYGNGFGARPVESSTPVALTNLNAAGRAELEQVPGIGPALAREIDDHRQRKGPFKSVDGLRQVKGVGPVTFDKVQGYFRVEPPKSVGVEPPIPEPLVLERKTVLTRPVAATSKLQPGDPPIDINAAGLAELLRLPGVGPVTAQNIVTARAEKPFDSVNDLDRVKGIGPKTVEKLRPFVVVK